MLPSSMRWNDGSASAPGGRCPDRHTKPGSSLMTSASAGNARGRAPAPPLGRCSPSGQRIDRLLATAERHRHDAGRPAAPSTAAAAAPRAGRAAARGGRRGPATSPAPTPAARPPARSRARRTATTIGERPVARLRRPAAVTTKRTANVIAASASATRTSSPGPTACRRSCATAPQCVSARRESWWYANDCSHTRSMTERQRRDQVHGHGDPGCHRRVAGALSEWSVREQHDQPGDHDGRHRQRLDRHRGTGREPHPHRGAQTRVVAVAERERDRQHRQRERRAVGVDRARDPQDRSAGGDQPGGEQRVARAS